MDFRMCPSCKQSILDDDVEDCPFCGASLSGKPSATKAPAAKAAGGKKAPAATSKAAATKPKPKPAKKTEPEKPAEDEDPFNIKSEARKLMPIVQKKPTPKAKLPVECPYCSSKGFVEAKNAGNNVRCYNKECLVPVFEAPVPVKKTEEKPEKAGLPTNLIVMISVGVAVLALMIGGFIFMNSGDGSIADDDGGRKRPPPGPEPGPIDSGGDGSNDPVPALEEQKISIAEMESKVMAALVKASQTAPNKREKTYGRQVTAESYSARGDISGAEEQMRYLDSLTKAIPFLKIGPQVEIAWHYLSVNDRAKATEYADQAVALSDRLPATGDEALDASTRLSALLVALERYDEATKLANKYSGNGLRNRLSAAMTVATASRHFDFNAAEAWPTARLLQHPEFYAIGRILSVKGYAEQGWNWVRTLTGARQRSELAGALLFGKNGNAADANVSQLSSLEQAYALAIQAHTTREAAEQKAVLAKALALLTAARIVEQPQLPDQKQIYQNRIKTFANEGELGSQAALLLAEVQAGLGADEEAIKMYDLAHEFARLATPDWSLVQREFDETNSNRNYVIGQLERLLKLNNRTAATSAFNQYRRNLEALKNTVESLVRMRQAFLVHELENGLIDSAWGRVEGESVPEQLSQRLLSDETGGVFVHVLKLNGENERAGRVESLLNLKPQFPWAWEVNRDINVKIQAGEFAKAANVIRQRQKQLKDLDERVLYYQLASAGAKAGEFTTVASSIERVTGIAAREESMKLIGGLTTERGNWTELWEYIGDLNPQPTSMAALCQGIALGLPAKPEPEPESTTTTQEAQQTAQLVQ